MAIPRARRLLLLATVLVALTGSRPAPGQDLGSQVYRPGPGLSPGFRQVSPPTIYRPATGVGGGIVTQDEPDLPIYYIFTNKSTKAAGLEYEPSNRSGDEFPRGYTLDDAARRMLCENLELRAAAEDVVQSGADLITAGLRNNPQFVPGVAQIPYGSFNNLTQGGPTVYNIQLSVPFDLTGKRRTRERSAAIGTEIAAANYRDAVRKQLDNLYTAFVDALAAQETLLNIKAIEADQKDYPAFDPATLRQARRTAQAAWEIKARSLCALLNLPYDPSAPIAVRGGLLVADPAVPTADELVAQALRSRPDLAAARLAAVRAGADYEVVRASRLDDVIVNFAPYTFGNGQPYDQRSATSWGLSANVPVPIFNHQQGNQMKAASVIRQAKLRVATAEQSVANEVRAARKAFDDTRSDVDDAKGEIRNVPTYFNDTREHRIEPDGLPNKQLTRLGDEMTHVMKKNYRDAVRRYHAAIVDHRKATLRLNTAVGCEVVPLSPAPEGLPPALR